MAELITCPECKKTLQVPESLVGSLVQCPDCTHTFTAMAQPPSAEKPSRSAPPPLPDKDPENAPRRKRRDRDEFEDDGDRRSSRKPRREVPGKVTAIGLMSLIGGIYCLSFFLGVGGGSSLICCLWPGLYFCLVVGILGIVKGSSLLGRTARDVPPPRTIAILFIINIINLDVISLVLGIVMLVFCGDPEVTEYLARE